MDHVSHPIAAMLNDVLDRTIRRLDTDLYSGKITMAEHTMHLRQLVEMNS